MAKRKKPTKDEEWRDDCVKLLKRARWLNDWEEDFLAEKVANEDAWTQPREEVTNKIRHQTNLVGSIGGHRVSDLIVSLMACKKHLDDDEEEFVERLHQEGHEYVGWRDAIRLVRLAQRFAI
ncbi:MAG: hypothetical protein R3C30_02855 [Hyphomonadaceae bacterium]